MLANILLFIIFLCSLFTVSHCIYIAKTCVETKTATEMIVDMLTELIRESLNKEEIIRRLDKYWEEEYGREKCE